MWHLQAMLKSGRKPNPYAYTGAKIVKIVTKLRKVKIYTCVTHTELMD